MKTSVARLFSSNIGPVVTGLTAGILAPLLVWLGNPGNMGLCVACFTRDIAGALGLHRAMMVQYLRPEIAGLVIGALLAAVPFGEFRPRSGSAPVVRFWLGMSAMVGALVFLGCPWRAYLRLSGGDWNALWGILGLAAGIGVGIVCLRWGFSLGRNYPAPRASGWVFPLIMVGLLALAVWMPLFGRDADGKPTGPIFSSTSGPGSQHAPLLVSLAVGLVIGFLAQRTRFCTVGALRDLALLRDPRLFYGIVAFIAAAFAANLALGQFKPGFQSQPAAHTQWLWNFGGMALSGLAFTLAGGCPGRQLVLSGEGDGDAAVFSLGMLAGAAVAHNFGLASSPAGTGPYGPAAMVIGLAVCAVIGMTMREPARNK